MRRLQPKPLVATSVEDILAAKGVKPSLSPNLNVLATVEALQVEKLLFIGVGCQVQALRSVQQYLPCKELYVMGTNCVDNGPREGLDKFLQTASASPDTALHYEFMQACSYGSSNRVSTLGRPYHLESGLLLHCCYSHCSAFPALADSR
jgi:7-hydroxymethyl chlorophyll a reductase